MQLPQPPRIVRRDDVLHLLDLDRVGVGGGGDGVFHGHLVLPLVLLVLPPHQLGERLEKVVRWWW